jgi:hypothetical protein
MSEAMLYIGVMVVGFSAFFTVSLLVVAMFTPAPQTSWVGKPESYVKRVLRRLDEL